MTPRSMFSIRETKKGKYKVYMGGFLLARFEFIKDAELFVDAKTRGVQ